MIRILDYSDVFEIWQNKLWLNRTSKIESVSAMLYLNGYDLENYKYEPTFFGYVVDDKIVGVNSGHKCADHTYRSRGLFVEKDYRHHGIGKDLLLATIEQGKKEYCTLVWSFPRKESWSVYQSAGFSLTSDWIFGETGINAYCKLDLM